MTNATIIEFIVLGIALVMLGFALDRLSKIRKDVDLVKRAVLGLHGD